MKTNIRYANIMIMALAIAYFIIGVINLFETVDGKVILLTSIVSLVVAIVQILDTVISALRVFEVNVLKVSIGFLNAWNLENDDKSYEEKSLKFEEYKSDQIKIHNSYEKCTKVLQWSANILLIIAMVIFVIGLSTDYIKGNAKLADTLSLFSFALMFLSFVVQTYLEKYINAIEKEIEIIFSKEDREETYNG